MQLYELREAIRQRDGEGEAEGGEGGEGGDGGARSAGGKGGT